MSEEAVGALPVAAAGALSVAELRAGMQHFLRSSGALGSLKTQVRGVIISELLRRKNVAPPPVSQSAAVGMRTSSRIKKNKNREDAEHIGSGRTTQEEKDDARAAVATAGKEDREEEEEEEEHSVDDGNDASWTQRLCDALVEDHLRHTSRSFSLAIFSSEADVSLGSAGDDGLAALLQFPICTSRSSASRVSLLQRLVGDHLRRAGDARGQPARYATGTQTDSADDGLSPPPLEQRLAAVDAKYALCFSRLGHSTREELERRMSAYKHDVHTQLEQSYQQRLRAFEEERLREVRAEAEAQSATLLQHKLDEAREASRAATARVEAERERMRMAREDVAVSRAEIERRERDMQRVLDERDAATATMESRLDEARQQVRLHKAQLQQCEELCASRLVELDAARAREWRRGEDIRRAQAEHVAEMQLKDEEIARLRFRVRSMTAATVSGSDGGNAGGVEEAVMKAYDAQRRLEQLHEQQLAPHTDVYYPFMRYPAPSTAQAEDAAGMKAAWQATWQREVDLRSSETPIEQRASKGEPPQLQETAEKPREESFAQAATTSPTPLPPLETHVPKNDESKDISAMGDIHIGPPPSSQSHHHHHEEEEEEHDHASDGDDSGEANVEAQCKETSASHSAAELPTAAPPSERSAAPQHFSSKSKSSSPSSSSPSPSAAAASQPSTGEFMEFVRSAIADESAARELVYGAEDVARRGIAWAARSQHTVLVAREEEQRAAAEQSLNSDDSAYEGRRLSGLDAYAAAAQQQQFENFIARDSDVESDGILFARRNGSSDESF